MTYKLVVEDNSEALEQSVNVLLGAGWRPQGGIAVSEYYAAGWDHKEQCPDGTHYSVFAQALVIEI